MEYHGKLYGKFNGKPFDTGKTSDDFDKLVKENEEMKAMLEEINRRCYILATEPNGIVRETMIDNLTDGISELIQKHKQ